MLWSGITQAAANATLDLTGLIYQTTETDLLLLRTGSHSELFD